MWRVAAALALSGLFGVPALALVPGDDLPEIPVKRVLENAFTTRESFVIRSIHRIEIGESREQGFLIPIWLPDRGRNFSAGVLLHRPQLKQTRLLDYGNVDFIPYLRGLNGRVAVLSSYESGQGSENSSQHVVQFDGWTVKRLGSGGFSNDVGKGECTAKAPCRHTSVVYQPVVGTNQMAKITLSGTVIEKIVPKTNVKVQFYEVTSDALRPIARYKK